MPQASCIRSFHSVSRTETGKRSILEKPAAILRPPHDHNNPKGGSVGSAPSSARLKGAPGAAGQAQPKHLVRSPSDARARALSACLACACLRAPFRLPIAATHDTMPSALPANELTRARPCCHARACAAQFSCPPDPSEKTTSYGHGRALGTRIARFLRACPDFLARPRASNAPLPLLPAFSALLTGIALLHSDIARAAARRTRLCFCNRGTLLPPHFCRPRPRLIAPAPRHIFAAASHLNDACLPAALSRLGAALILLPWVAARARTGLS